MKRRDFLVTTATMAGASIPVVGFAQSKPCPPPSISAGGGSTASTSCSTSSAAADWATRIAGAGVVWYHNFDSKAEVDQFRWTGGYSGGNDPNSRGAGGNFVTHQASGGADGGGFLRLTYPLGSVSGRGGSYWHRPFNALTGAGNGRGVDDPGASGTIAPVAFPVSDGSSTLYSWGTQSNPGWYMHATHQASNPGKFQGSDYWLQVRVRRAETPGAPPDSADYSHITGKLVWLTTTNSSYTAQELVTYGQSASNGDTVGTRSRHNVYSGQNFNSLSGGQPNATVTLANTNLNWRFSGGWDTLLYHVTPGTNGGTGDNRTRVEVWVARQGETAYTKIWDVTYSQGFDGGANSVGAAGLPGWNALILAIYHNGSSFTTTAFNFDYDQVIFSKQFIACPTA